MKLYLNILYIKQLDFILFVFNNLKLKIRYIIDKINIYNFSNSYNHIILFFCSLRSLKNNNLINLIIFILQKLLLTFI